jgi:hypothetical protein
MSMQLITGLIYCVAVMVWLAVLGIVLFEYVRNPRIFGTPRLLLLVVAIDTCRNLIENVYFGLFFGGQYEFFPAALAESLGNPALVIIPKALNIVAGGFVLGLLLLRWLPQAVTERGLSDRLVVDLGMLATTDGLTSLFNRATLKNWRARNGRAFSATAVRSRCCCSTSTTSNRSMIASVMTPATWS